MLAVPIRPNPANKGRFKARAFWHEKLWGSELGLRRINQDWMTGEVLRTQFRILKRPNGVTRERNTALLLTGFDGALQVNAWHWCQYPGLHDLPLHSRLRLYIESG